MKKQVLVIHGGDAFESYEEYLQELQNKQVSLDRLKFKDWKKNLAEDLGSDYDVLYPQMPNSWNARYKEWKIWFEKLIPLLDEEVILIGHSLGAIFLVKYLSENNFPKKVLATFLVAAPFNTENQHPLVDFVISENLTKLIEQGGKIFLHHSQDDKVVPFSNLKSYQKLLPDVNIKVLKDRGHFNQESFPELVEDINSL